MTTHSTALSAITAAAWALGQAGTSPQGATNLYVLWGLILLGAAVLLLFLEIFIPSGGVIGVFAVLSAVAGIVLFFQVNTTLGLIGATVALIAVPFLVAFALKIWPNTPIGRLLILRNPKAPQDGSDPAASGKADNASLVGRVGRALSDLRPVGTCLIDDQRIDCLSEHGVIRAGTRVRVVSVDGMQIKVRPEQN